MRSVSQPLDALRKAAADSEDIEIRRRAEMLISQIEERLASTDIKSNPPPKGAVVLFDGKNLDAWVARDGQTDPDWRVIFGKVMQAEKSDIRTRQTYSDPYKLHLEFRVPLLAGGDPQRGNSGVYLHGRYEVQILDSYGRDADKWPCGAIYGFALPRVNVSKKPDVWQSYDIEFQPPRFKDGAFLEAARVTVFHNGTRVHDKLELPLESPGDGGLPDDASEPGPILLQYHATPVQFRNVWVLLPS
jgi:hypothetical protein